MSPEFGTYDKDKSYYNSNSFTSGILKEAGGDVSDPWGYQPGLDKPIPIPLTPVGEQR